MFDKPNTYTRASCRIRWKLSDFYLQRRVFNVSKCRKRKRKQKHKLRYDKWIHNIILLLHLQLTNIFGDYTL